MIKRILEISQRAAHLSVKNKQLKVRFHDQEQADIRSFPCEDLGVVCVDNLRTTYTHQALVELMEYGVPVVICGQKHLPVAQLLPYSAHAEVANRLRLQIDASRPTQKRLWQQLVRAKILVQAENLEWKEGRKRLQRMVKKVASGDPSNYEAQAARYYWANFFGKGERADRIAGARDPLNSMLNYGYAIMRAAVARALVIGGFQPALGIHHKNRSNAFCLADDFLEPFRPAVDRVARRLIREGYDELTPDVKGQLLTLLTSTVQTYDRVGPLMVALHFMTASFKRCLEGDDKQLEIPVFVDLL